MATMKAALAKSFGDAVDVLTVSPAVPRPRPPGKGEVLIQVHAVSLSPSDYRMLSGAADLVKKPPRGKWPYIPGGDVCGVVEETGPAEPTLRVGDPVIATWSMFGIGGIAEYALVNTRYVARRPSNVSFLEGAALANSAQNALLAVDRTSLAPADRLLVLGGSGAVGTALIQLARNVGVSYIAATSTDVPLVSSLGADAVINYRQQNWWEAPEIRAQPFDVVIDCAEGVSAWRRVLEHGIIKGGREGGRFLAVVINEWHIEMHNAFAMVKWFWPVICRRLGSRLRPALPRYTMHFPAPHGDSMKRTLDLVEQGKLKVVIDPESPHPFTTDGVVAAFDKMINRRGHGKVVIAIRDD